MEEFFADDRCDPRRNLLPETPANEIKFAPASSDDHTQLTGERIRALLLRLRCAQDMLDDSERGLALRTGLLSPQSLYEDSEGYNSGDDQTRYNQSRHNSPSLRWTSSAAAINIGYRLGAIFTGRMRRPRTGLVRRFVRRAPNQLATHYGAVHNGVYTTDDVKTFKRIGLQRFVLGERLRRIKAESPGGQKLRELREARGLSREEVWHRVAELSERYLEKIESGTVGRTSLVKLNAILDFYEVIYAERLEVLRLFGYSTGLPAPTQAEVKLACDGSKEVMDELAVPAYLLDNALRMRCYNRYLAAMLGAPVDSPEMRGLLGKPLFVSIYDPDSWLYSRLRFLDSDLRWLMKTLQHELKPFLNEGWCRRTVSDCKRRLPLFRRLWEEIEHAGVPDVTGGAMKSLESDLPHLGKFAFRISVELYASDRRFRIVCLIPTDPDFQAKLVEVTNRSDAAYRFDSRVDRLIR